MPDIAIETAAAMAVVIVLAGLVHGTLGLGFPVVATPLLALLLDVRLAILLTLLPTAAVNVASIFGGGDWREALRQYWPLAVYSIVGSLVGARLVVVLDPAPFKLLLAALILAYLGVTRWQGFTIPFTRTHPRIAMLVFGLAAGFAAGTTNVMVPVLIVYSLELGLGRPRMVALFNLCFLAGKLAQIATFAGAGLLDAEVLLVTAGLAVIALVALAAGMRLGARIDRDTYTRWVRRLLALLAALLIGQFVTGYG